MDTNLFMQNLQSALVVTVIGMLSVLIFLTIMIWAMHIMEKVISYINEIFPPETEKTASKRDTNKKSEEEIAVAIAAVIANENRA